jgi:hypothetical protein
MKERRISMRTKLAIAVLCGLGAVAAQAADDDLTVVKRAVQHPEGARPAAHGEARWFRVRVDKREGGKVRVNLPLPFVRAIGAKADSETGPLGFHCGRAGHPCSLKLSEILSALDAGQEFVTIEDEDASVRVWID